jgi:hypothetical protein
MRTMKKNDASDEPRKFFEHLMTPGQQLRHRTDQAQRVVVR